MVTYLIMQAPILLFLKLPGLYLINQFCPFHCSRISQLLCCTVMHTQCMRLKLPVGWGVGQAQIDSDAPAMGSTTGPCVFRCKSGVHVIVNGACLRHRLRSELLFFVDSKLIRKFNHITPLTLMLAGRFKTH